MKKSKLLILFLGSILSLPLSAALHYSSETNVYSHLREVNQQWDTNDGALPMQNTHFSNDKERIRFHLLSVIDILKKKSNEGLSASQVANRKDLLDELVGYAWQMNFPINKAYDYRRPCFIDEYNNFCAVGYMMKVSGFESVARDIQREQNYAYLSDIHHNAVQSWAVENGFDVQELAWIQPGYPPANAFQSIGAGTNGDVNDSFSIENKVYFIGDFTELDSEPCDGVGVYQDGSAECILNGLQGTLNDVHVTYSGVVWVTGALQHNGISYPLASFENGVWDYYSIGSNANAIGREVIITGFNVQCVTLQVGEEHQMWMRQNNQGWAHKLTFNGPVNAITWALDQIFFGGRFNEVTIHFPTSNNQVLNANNLISVDYLFSQLYPESWTAYTANVPSEINVLYRLGNVLYIGGKANSTNTALLARFQNNSFHTMLDIPAGSTENFSINDMTMFNDNSLFVGGDLASSLMNAPSMTYGRHLFQYEIATGYLYSIADFNAPVKCLGTSNGYAIIGGEFVQNVGVPMNHLAKSITTSSVVEMENLAQFEMFPNPASDNLQINFDSPQSGMLRITDLAGRILHEAKMVNQIRMNLDVSRWSTQVVLVSIIDESKNMKSQRLVIR